MAIASGAALTSSILLNEAAKKGTSNQASGKRQGKSSLRTKSLKRPVQEGDVGRYNDLKNRSVPGDGLEVHHFPQKHPAKQVIPGYDERTGTAVVLPKKSHQRIATQKGSFSGNARDLLARDAWGMRSVNRPNQEVQRVLKEAKRAYSTAVKKGTKP